MEAYCNSSLGYILGHRDSISDFKTSRHYLASVPTHTLPAPLRG